MDRLQSGAYEQPLWSPTGRVFYIPQPDRPACEELRHAAAHFFTPRRYVDPFGNATRVRYDLHDLMPVETIDAVGNVERAAIDYRVLAPWLQIDPNGNRSEVAFDVPYQDYSWMAYLARAGVPVDFVGRRRHPGRRLGTCPFRKPCAQSPRSSCQAQPLQRPRHRLFP